MGNTVDTIRTLLSKDGFALPKTSGRSMRPLLWGGQHRVVIVPLDSEPEPGDILMFRLTNGGQEKSIVHRLVEIRQRNGEPVYITRGDNCLVSETVCRNEIIGRVAEVHRLSGYRPWHIIPKQKFTVTDASYRRYVRLWTAIWPARRMYYAIRYRAHRVWGRVKSLLNPR